MIWESSYWKSDLHENADVLVNWGEREDFVDRERLFVELEKLIFLSFYSIRKLEEAQKLSDEMLSERFSLQTYPLKSIQSPDFFNSHKISEFYDLDSTNTSSLGIRQICNQFIHSFVFQIQCRENGSLEGVYFASDFMKKEGVYFVSVELLANIIRQVADDDILAIQWERNRETGLMERKSASRHASV